MRRAPSVASRPTSALRAQAAAQSMALPGRSVGIDALRGVAIVAMIAYHFCFDLRHFGFAGWDFYRDPFWLHARTVILSSFLLLAGVSLVLAEATPAGKERFWRHVARIAVCAVVVSIASYIAFPRSMIWFGVLHAIAVSLVLIRPLTKHPLLALGVGLVVIVAGATLSVPAFDRPAFGWLGFMPAKPVTEDYVPLFPWTGVMLVGIALGHGLQRGTPRAVTLAAGLPAPLAWLGRHSLAVYMVHQPLLFGALYIVAAA
jgi:uncharacterized membrane protein